MKNDEMTKISIIVVPVSWAIGGLIILLMWLCCSNADRAIWAKSCLLGLVTALLNFGLQISFGKGFIREVNRRDGAPIRSSVLGYVVRLFLAGLVFAYIIYDSRSSNPRFDVIPALIGYLVVKLVFIIVSLIINLKKKKVSE